MKLGTENRAKVIAAAVLGIIVLFRLAYMLWPTAQSPAPVAQPAASGTAQRGTPRRTTGGRAIKITEPRLDPTLDLSLLRQSEQIKYAGNGRNIFVAGLPVPVDSGRTDKPETQAYVVPPTPPPPPINLKFFGFASKPGEPKRVFLQQGEDVFVANEGDIVNRRYRVLRIAPNSVDIEDVLNSNRQSIPLTQG